MRVIFTDEGKADLKRLDRNVVNRIVAKLFWLADNLPVHRHQPLGGQFKGLYKLRVGDWRVAYDFEDKQITAHLIDHRSKIYKRR